MSLSEGYEWLSGHVDAFKEFYAALGVLLSAWVVSRHFVPAALLLKRTVYRSQSNVRGLSKALWDALGFVLRGHVSHGRLWTAARYRIEAELLRPAPESPRRSDYERREVYRAAKADYRARLETWQDDIASRVKTARREEFKPGAVLLEVDNCFGINNRVDEIRNYFRVLERNHARDDRKSLAFLSHVRVTEGFLAPLHLLAGLLAEAADNWKPVIDDYGRAIKTAGGAHNLAALRAFQFDCWLLWGPSIPICTCEQWTGEKFIQLGYGDENNSIAVHRGEREALDPTSLKGRTGMAVRAGVTGRLRLGAYLDHTKFCPAQQSVIGERRVVLERIAEYDIAAGGTSEEVTRTYYSAYIWAMLVVCDADGRPRDPERPWRNLLPFFEHGNLANVHTFDLLKRQLVAKLLTGARALLDADKKLQLRYACAIDDSMCGSPLAWPAPAGGSIRELILAQPSIERLVVEPVDPVQGPWLDGDYCACHLPDLLEKFYLTIRQ